MAAAGRVRAQLNTSTCFADPSSRIGVAMFSTAATTAVPVPATRVVRRPSPIDPIEINNLRCGKFTQMTRTDVDPHRRPESQRTRPALPA